MGVLGTFCQLCGLPTQHDHYVSDAGGQGFKIYRGSAPDGGHIWGPEERPFLFGPEHAWLKDAIVLPWGKEHVLRGPIEDGAIDDKGDRVFVAEGSDDGLAFHHACWVLQGSPPQANTAARSEGVHGWALLTAYHQQLFDFAGLKADGKAWMLADPTTDERSRARIEALLAASLKDPKNTVELRELVHLDRDWSSMPVSDSDNQPQAMVRGRLHSIRNGDKADFTTLLRATRFYDGKTVPSADVAADLEAFEWALKQTVERDARGMLALIVFHQGRAEFLVYSPDAKALEAVVKALPGAAGFRFEVSTDPNWKEATALLEAARVR